MKPLMITIPEPCHENWNTMTAAEQGRYCLSCSKVVKDFSLMEDDAIKTYLQNVNGQVCGRFETQQINRTLTTKKKNNGLLNHWWKLLLPGFFFSFKAAAQKTLPQELQGKDSIIRTNHRDMILGMVAMKVIPQETTTTNKTTRTVRQLRIRQTFALLNDQVKISAPIEKPDSNVGLSFMNVQKGEYTAVITDENGIEVQRNTFVVPDENYFFQLSLQQNIGAGAYLLRISDKNGQLFYNGKIVAEE